MENSIEETLKVIRKGCEEAAKKKGRLVRVLASDVVAIIDHLESKPGGKVPKENKS